MPMHKKKKGMAKGGYGTPTRKKQGDIVYADGTNFDPGGGEGIYFVNAAGNYTKL